MFGFMRSPVNQGSKLNSVDEGSTGHYTNPFDSDSSSSDLKGCDYNPFDSDTESDTIGPEKQTLVTGRERASEVVVSVPDFGTPDRKLYDSDGEDDVGHTSVLGVENQLVHKVEETTGTVKRCLKIAEEIRGDAVRTLEMLHRQGQQITRSHHVAVDIERDLSRGEKLLGSLGSIFSRTWKPVKGRDIIGPLTITDDHSNQYQHNKDQRENLGVSSVPKIRSVTKTAHLDPTDTFQKVQLEKERQDDALSDLSNILGDLKDMALEMGSEIDRQNKALDHFGGDIDELNLRVKGANQRTRRLLG